MTPLHKDSTDNFAYQVCDSKRWTIFPVRDVPFLSLTRLLEHSDYATSCIDPRNVQLPEYPEYKQAQPIEFELHAGEMLYLPAGWSHQVENMSMSMMVYYWMSRDYFAAQES